MTRGRLAREAGCNIETIRYYERIGLLPAPSRARNGYRLYGDPTCRRLRFVLRGRELGFSIEELRELLRLVDGGRYSCGDVRDLTLAHAKLIRHKIADLRRLERTLMDIAGRCTGSAVPDCPVINALTGAR